MDHSINPLLNQELPEFIFPDYEQILLSNGLRIVFHIDDTQPLVSLKTSFAKGAFEDKVSGLGSAVAYLMTKGTERMNAVKVAEEIDSIGASFNAVCGWDFTTVSILTQADYLRKAFKILTDALFLPKFEQSELDRYKLKQLAVFEQEQADPDAIAVKLFNRHFNPGHPYSNNISGDKDSLAKIKLEKCIEWHQSLISRRDPLLIVSGNFTVKSIMLLVDEFFTGRQFTELPPPNKEFKPLSSKLVIAHKKDSNQTVLRIGKPVVSPRHPDSPAMNFANTIFGGYFLSRLNKLLREELGYTYGVYSSVSNKKQRSALIIGGGFNKESTSDTVARIIDEMNKFSIAPVDAEEFNIARQYSLGSYLRLTETPQQISELLLSQIQNGLSDYHYDEYYNKIRQLTIDDLFEVQKKYFTPDNMLIAAVGDEDYLRQELASFE